jgi:hypothetical protein
MTGDESRTLKVGDRVCWGATSTDLGTVIEINWAGVLAWNLSRPRAQRGVGVRLRDADTLAPVILVAWHPMRSAVTVPSEPLPFEQAISEGRLS